MNKQPIATLRESINLYREQLETLCNKISALPQNHDIKPLGKGCFMINSKNFSSDLVLSPYYYDFTYQYEQIVLTIKRRNPEQLIAFCTQLVRKKTIVICTNHRMRLHPTVADTLEKLFIDEGLVLENKKTMTKQDLKAIGVDIEPYGGGFMISDYSGKVETQFGARYCGESQDWRDQPVVTDPFHTEQDAINTASKLFTIT